MIPKDYVNLKILGRNANGDITKKVRSLLDQKLYVIKSLGGRKLSENQKKILNILKDDKCPFIVNHYPLDEINNEIKTDFINNGDLLEYVNTFNDLGQPIEENVLLNIFSQCAESIKYLHDKRIIHRNIRLENFYMTEDMDIKLGNFIYVTFMNGIDEKINYPEEGMLYKNADTLNNSTYNEKSDIYALGVLFYKMCYFEFPYEIKYIDNNENPNKGSYELKKNEKIVIRNYSEDLKKMINKMIDPNENIKIDDICKIIYDLKNLKKNEL